MQIESKKTCVSVRVVTWNNLPSCIFFHSKIKSLFTSKVDYYYSWQLFQWKVPEHIKFFFIKQPLMADRCSSLLSVCLSPSLALFPAPDSKMIEACTAYKSMSHFLAHITYIKKKRKEKQNDKQSERKDIEEKEWKRSSSLFTSVKHKVILKTFSQKQLSLRNLVDQSFFLYIYTSSKTILTCS